MILRSLFEDVVTIAVQWTSHVIGPVVMVLLAETRVLSTVVTLDCARAFVVLLLYATGSTDWGVVFVGAVSSTVTNLETVLALVNQDPST